MRYLHLQRGSDFWESMLIVSEVKLCCTVVYTLTRKLKSVCKFKYHWSGLVFFLSTPAQYMQSCFFFNLASYFHLTNLLHMWLKPCLLHPSCSYLWLCLNGPESHQAAQPCCATSSTFPHCKKVVFPGRDVIVSCQLPERPGRSHQEWCAGYKKAVTNLILLQYFLRGKLGSTIVKDTTVEQSATWPKPTSWWCCHPSCGWLHLSPWWRTQVEDSGGTLATAGAEPG